MERANRCIGACVFAIFLPHFVVTLREEIVRLKDNRKYHHTEFNHRTSEGLNDEQVNVLQRVATSKLGMQPAKRKCTARYMYPEKFTYNKIGISEQKTLKWTHQALFGGFNHSNDFNVYLNAKSYNYSLYPRKGRRILHKVDDVDLQNDINRYSPVASAQCPYSDFCFVNGSKIKSHISTMTSCCKACYCDRKCGERLDCCFEGIDQDKIVKTNKLVCILPRLGGDKYLADSYQSFYMVDKCLDKVTTSCENTSSSSLGPLYPVYSPAADKIYLNRECAECNGVYDSLNWTSYMTCKDDDLSFLSLSLEELNKTTCEVTFVPPESIALDKFNCYYNMVDSCNISGKWVEYDDDTKVACENIRAPVYSGKIYANVFCKLCNVYAHNPTKICEIDDWYTSVTRTSTKNFVVLLDYQSIVQGNSYTEDAVLENKMCGQAEVLHPFKNECRKVLCPNGAIRASDGCKTFAKTWQKKGYIVHVCLTPTGRELIPVAALWNITRVKQRKLRLRFDTAGIPIEKFVLLANLVEQNNVSYVKQLELLLGSQYGPLNATETLHAVALAISRKWGIQLDKVYSYHVELSKYRQILKPNLYRNLDDYRRSQTLGQEESIWLKIVYHFSFGAMSITKMHFCEQVELKPGEWQTLSTREIKLNLSSSIDGKFLGDAEFNFVKTEDGDRVWVCVEEFNKDYYTDRGYKGHAQQSSASLRIIPFSMLFIYMMLS